MPTFRLDVFAWIPMPEVPNPINALPGGVARWGPGACGPYFGGDNFVTPPTAHGSWLPRTFRATQTFSFSVGAIGDAPATLINTGVRPGTTTVLTNRRSASGVVCHALTATVKTSAASVTWDASNRWYEVSMHGEAQDPVPAAVGGATAGRLGAVAASALTPNLEWDLTARFQAGATIPLTTRARYAVSSPLNLDVSATTFPALTAFGAGGGNLLHGLIMVRRFPSYVAYATIDTGSGPSTIPIYFADAMSRSLAAIAVGQTDVLRRFAW